MSLKEGSQLGMLMAKPPSASVYTGVTSTLPVHNISSLQEPRAHARDRTHPGWVGLV